MLPEPLPFALRASGSRLPAPGRITQGGRARTHAGSPSGAGPCREPKIVEPPCVRSGPARAISWRSVAYRSPWPRSEGAVLVDPIRRLRVGVITRYFLVVLLSDRDLKAEIESGRMKIDPYDPGMVQPSSIDVRLDRYFRVFENHKYPHIDPAVEQPDLTRL